MSLDLQTNEFYSKNTGKCLLTLYKPFKASYQIKNITFDTATLLNKYKVAEYNQTHAKLINRINSSIQPYYLVSYNSLLECMSPGIINQNFNNKTDNYSKAADYSNKADELEPVLYVIMMLAIFMIAFTCQLSFNYGNNRQYSQMYRNDKFVKEWLSSNTHTGATKKQRKRTPLHRRSKRNSLNTSMTSNLEERHLLSKLNKSPKDSKFSIARSYTKLSNIGKIRNFKKPSSYGTEIPAITVQNDNYSSHDSNKTF